MSARLTAGILAVAMIAVGVGAGLAGSRVAATVAPALLGPVEIVADFDGGGLADDVTLRGDDIEITFAERHTALQLPALVETTALAVGDIDHDGDLDLVSLGRDGLRGWINQGSGSFTAWTVTVSSSPLVPVHMAAVHWSRFGAALLSVVTSRSPSDGLVAAPGAAGVSIVPTASVGSTDGRAPPPVDASPGSPRAPPQTFSA